MGKPSESVVTKIAKSLKCNPEDVRAVSADGSVAAVVTERDAFKVSISADGKIARILADGQLAEPAPVADESTSGAAA